MSSILSTVLFASAAAAQITTSIWLPAPYGVEDYTFKASVIASEADAVTMAIDMKVDGEDIASTADIITFHGTTAFENIITTTDAYGDYEGDLTVSYGCTKQRSGPVCAYSYNGPVAWSSFCEDYTSYTTVITSTVTYGDLEEVVTEDYRDQVPSFCLSGSVLPEEWAIETASAEDIDVQTYAVTITAGEEILGATAGATPTNSAASPTKSSSETPARTPTSSGSGSASSPSGSPSGTPSPPAEQSTGAAAPMNTLAPALAGLGALVAALL
jgi:hypothetical protein